LLPLLISIILSVSPLFCCNEVLLLVAIGDEAGQTVEAEGETSECQRAKKEK